MTSLTLNPSRWRRPTTPRAPASPWLVLVLILACQLMIIVDASVVITALPEIKQGLHFSPTSLSWVQNAYTLAFGGLMLLGARAGDILGRRRMFVWGIGVFTVASLAGGLAESSWWLLTARAVQGIAAAVAAPSTLALLMTTFTEARQRVRAVGFYSSISGAGSSAGLVIGGLLTDALSWRWGLFINVPIGLALVLLAPRYLPETERNPGHFDLGGALTSTLGMTAIVYAFVRAAADGWSDPVTLASFIAGVALLVGFVFQERRARQPITPLRLFADRSRSGANVARLLLVGGMFSFFFFVSQYLQGVRGYDALKAGLAFLPMTVVLFLMVQVAGVLATRFTRIQMLAGGIFIALAGMAWLSRLNEHTQYFPGIALPMVLLGSGIGLAFIPLTSLAIDGVSPEDSGAASGLVNVSQQVGGSLGLAVMVTIFGTASRSAERHPIAGSASEVAAHNLAHGVSTALTGSVAFLTASLAVVLLMVRQRSAPAAAPVALVPDREPELVSVGVVADEALGDCA